MSHVDPDVRGTQSGGPAFEAFSCGFHRAGRGAAWVNVSGELDLAAAPQFQQTLERAQQSALLIVIDLRRVTFIDSTGLHTIIDAQTRAREADRRVVLVRGPQAVDRIFALAGVTDRLQIIDLTTNRERP